MKVDSISEYQPVNRWAQCEAVVDLIGPSCISCQAQIVFEAHRAADPSPSAFHIFHTKFCWYISACLGHPLFSKLSSGESTITLIKQKVKVSHNNIIEEDFL